MKKKVHCYICKSISKSIFYLCKSGHHVICENCLHNDCMNTRKDNSDYEPEKECAPTSKKEISDISHVEINTRDQSSGDHSITVETYKHLTRNNEKPVKNGLCPTSNTKGCCSKYKPTTKVIYRNEKFDDNQSSIALNNVSPGYVSTKETTRESTSSRPVMCPVTSCSKIVTIDSLSQHFNFDHSRVPRILLNKIEPHEILLNLSTLSEEAKCIATFVISQEKRITQTALRPIKSHTNIHNLHKECDIMLLMVAKVLIGHKNFPNKKSTSRDSVCKSYTSIEYTRKNNDQTNIMYTKKSQLQNSNRVNNNKDDYEIILLWLCRLNDINGIYTINISREDKQQGYSYIGEAVHIRHEQDPISIYTKTNCLSLRRTAVNKLLTAENELKVIISTVQ